MSTRIVVGLVALPFVIIPMWYGGIWITLLAVIIALTGGYEFYALLRKCGYRPVQWIGLPWLTAIIFFYWLTDTFDIPALTLSTVLTAGIILTFMYALFQKEHPLNVWIPTSIVAIYLGITLGQALSLRLLPNGFWWLLFGLLVTWANDSAAYFVGVWFGRTKLWPRLSPKKTWEGTIGGIVGAALMAALLVWITPVRPPVWFGALVGLVGGFLAIFGDLSISMLKRQAGAKDSGRFLPGHGGVLDRLDSPLFVLPFIYQAVLFYLTIWES